MSLFAVLDEETSNTADYITSTTVGAYAEMGLSAIDDPNSSTGQVVTYVAKSPYAGWVRVTLKQSTTTIATWDQKLTTSFATYEHTLATNEADAITDYSALRLVFTVL
jgi:uncharacterized membrane protein affecting hemolysin expression